MLREQLPGKAHPEKVGTVARCKGVLCSSASERARIAAGLVALGERRYEAWAARAVALSEDGQFTFSTRATCSASSLALDSLRAKDYPDNLLPWIRKAHAMDAESVKLTTLAALR
ncbi:MAG: hypothetical protein HYZ28_05055 [Myxococcales bacterium]|nr:hypothetical protein [Myxococcales bacterium]